MNCSFDKFCREFTPYYVKVRTALKKKEIGFYLEAYPIGIPCELVYRNGILSELKQDSVYENSLVSVLFNHIKDSGLNGIPLRLHECADATFKGIITLNKHQLISYICKTDLSNIIYKTNLSNNIIYKLSTAFSDKTRCVDDGIPNSVFYKNLITLLELEIEKDVCFPREEVDDAISYNREMMYHLIKLMYDVPTLTGFIYPKTKQYINNINIQRKDLFEFVVFNHDTTPKIPIKNLTYFNFVLGLTTLI